METDVATQAPDQSGDDQTAAALPIPARRSAIIPRPYFDPSEHMQTIGKGDKAGEYLAVKWRVVWLRQEHPDAYITTTMLEHDQAAGVAVFKAEVGWYQLRPDAETEQFVHIHATAHGSEQRTHFPEYLEKAETKSVGRALAMLGYGTAEAMELDEGEELHGLAESPVQRRSSGANGRSSSRQPQPAQAQARRPARTAEQVAAEAQAAADREADMLNKLRDKVAARTGTLPRELYDKLPKPVIEMDGAELSKTWAWLERIRKAEQSA